MKLIKALAAVFTAVCSLSAFADRLANPVLRVMPLGDSITYGSCSESGGGYRAPLWQLLVNGNYNVDFVGTQTNNPRKDGSLGDVDHEGHGGWRLSGSSNGVYENINAWFGQIRDPHVILLHLGTNDTGDGETTFCAEATNRLVRLLDRIHACQPSAKIVVTTLLRRIGSDANNQKRAWIERAYNPFIKGIVAEQRTKGQDAYFLDMCSAVTDDGLHTDGLHPKDTGYAMMADAWYAKLRELYPDPTAVGGVNTPALVDRKVAASGAGTKITLFFNQPMDAAQLADAATWTVTGATASWAVQSVNGGKGVEFAFTPADFGKTVTIAATGLAAAESATATCDLAAESFMLARAAGAENNVSAAARAGYELVYDLDIPAAGVKYQYNLPDYKADNHAKIGAFSRVGYYLELQKSGGDVEYVWVSMDAFTDDAAKIGVPVAWTFQKDVANLFIESNVAGIRTGGTIPQGNIEFWPDSYGQANKRGLAGADANLYDHDDTPNGAGSYYGSMQVHDTALGGDGCVFAFNRWAGATDNSDIGIGKCTQKSSATDWTQMCNSGSYTLRHLQVYALPAPATTAPALVSVTRDGANSRLTVRFSMPVADGSLAACFALKGGRVTKATRSETDYSVVFVDYVADGADVEVTVSGVREASSALLPMAAPVTVAPAVAGVPAEVADLVGDASLTAGYDVLYQVDIPAAHVNWLTAEGGTAVPYTVKREDYPRNVDRVAYFLELRGNDGHKWVWVSMDAFSPDVRKFGVPVSADRAVKQRWVKNMDVKSNVSGIVNGKGMDGGFVEFWHMNYSGSNALGIPGATDSYDFGDSMSDSGNYGCMQVHSVTNKQTLFAFNNFGKNNSNASCLGIGNDTYKSGNGVNPDWTFHYTAGEYTSRRLWVFVRPGAPVLPAAPPPAEVAANVPDAANFSHLYTLDLPASDCAARTPASYTSYHKVDNRAAFQGAKPARVAYYLELVKADGTTNWCWTAFNAVTDNLNLYSLPTNTVVQQRVSNLDVRSNVPAVTEVTGCETGNIEFFPMDYSGTNKLGLPGADNSQYDFDDTPSPGGSHGCMQVHNWGAKQTCWAVGHLNAGTLDVGIGNSSATKTDWTLTNTGTQYTSRRLHVFVQFAEESPAVSAAPALRRVTASCDGTKLCVAFAAEPPADFDGAVYEIQTVRTGAVVKEVARSPFDPREYIVTLTRPLAAGTQYTLKGGVRRASGDVAFSKAFTTPAASVAAPHLTAENIPELPGYALVNAFAFGAGGVSITANGADYEVDESRFGVAPFDRVAYYLELEDNEGETQWVWASMDAFTDDAGKLGLPTVLRGNFFQQYVDNLTVCSGADGREGATARAVAGTFAKGNIEIWPSDYVQGNNKGVPGASDGVFDFGDTPNNGGLSAGHGCLQVHDYLNRRTVLAINCLNGTPALGIGSDTEQTWNGVNPDWTHHSNADSFKTRRFYVFVRPASASTGAAFDREPADATVDVGAVAELVASAPGATGYCWIVDGAVVAGQNGAVLRLPSLSEGAHTVQAVALFADGTRTFGRTTTLTVAWPADFKTQTIRIMPLGDSITQGVMGDKAAYRGGYRRKLWEKLTAAHYSVDFVGSTTADSGDMADPQHEGHSGWWISHPDKGIYENILRWSAGILNPHVVLMLIGTNDLGDGNTFKTKIDVLDQLIDRVAVAHPGAIIIVSPLLERSAGAYQTIQTYFNPFVRDRVLSHQKKGQKVRFWDIPSYVPLSDMADQLHPGEVGYEKMAQGWFDAIQEIWPTPMDVEVDNTPGILSATIDADTRRTCKLVFNTLLDAASATDVANWSVTDGTIASVALAADKRTATVTFGAALPTGRAYTLTVRGVQDEAKTAAMPETVREFFVSIPRGVENNVPAGELAQYEQVYALDIAANNVDYAVNAVRYAVDNHLRTQPFRRVAYYLELRRENENLQYVWVSMDAFTDDAGKIGLPTRAAQAFFQQKVTNLKVWSNVVPSGDIAEGNIEFWPYTYTQGAGLGLPGRNDSAYDFDDYCGKGSNYGSMQVHDYLNRTTLLSYGRWGGNGTSQQDLGIGNCPLAGVANGTIGTRGSDWTFSANSASYEVRRLEVWAMPDVAAEPVVTPVSARLAPSGRQMLVAFDRVPDPAQKLAPCFALSDGSVPAAAEILPTDAKVVRLSFDAPVAAEGLEVTVSGVCIDTMRGTKMPAPVTLAVADYVVPAVAERLGDSLKGFKLVYDLAVPVKGDWQAKGADRMYDVNDAKFFTGSFDRVGYYFELVRGDYTTQYVWTAFAPHVAAVDRTGIPIMAGAYSQQTVEDMEVKSNVSGITQGTGIATGNIEMWRSDYMQANAVNIPNANAGWYDFGDTRSSDSAGYGCFQVHNHGAKQTLFAINHWGVDGSAPCVGIGNDAANAWNQDWTFADNAPNYLSRRLLVFVRPAADAVACPAPAAVTERVADAAGFEHVYTVDLPAKPKFNDAASNTACHVVNNAAKLQHAYRGSAPARLAYMLELVDKSGNTTWVWTAMDAFTNRLDGISIPHNFVNWRTVENLDVESNVASVPSRRGVATGNIEFCRYNYSAGVKLGLGGSGSDFDYDDTPGTGGAYGCMQVHDHGAKQTLWALNNFNSQDANGLCVGIGSNAGSNKDWTHTWTAANYTSRRLYVFARWNVADETVRTAASFRRAIGGASDRAVVCATFDEPVTDAQAAAANFTCTAGAVVSAKVSPTEPRDVLLAFAAPLAADTSYSVSFTDPLTGKATTRAFTTPRAELAAVVAAVDEAAGYTLVNELQIPDSAAISARGANYRQDESRFRAGVVFDRVAYCLELETTNGVKSWAWTSMDAFTADLSKIGVPTVERGIFWQQYVQNLHVRVGSSGTAPNVTAGDFARGNLEFWPGNYSEPNQKGIPGADPSGNVFDFGDTANADAKRVGYGSMQVHATDQRKTVWAFNSFGSSNGPDSAQEPGLGVGNNAGGNTDWTHVHNARSFRVKNLYVLVREMELVPTPGAFMLQPEDKSVAVGSAPFHLAAFAKGAVSYQWRRNGEPIPGATESWCEVVPAKSGTFHYDVLAMYADGTVALSEAAEVIVFSRGTTIHVR
ncbi:MAG: SGNH/GDSL hydrolase family protein [Kiritimatiellae bacterium]|nr:SGNH/GDSL hydrolase family protein [Kiritimatiellia bacterium]